MSSHSINIYKYIKMLMRNGIGIYTQSTSPQNVYPLQREKNVK